MCVAQSIVWFVCEGKLRTGHSADTRLTGSVVESCVLSVLCLLNMELVGESLDEWSSSVGV